MSLLFGFSVSCTTKQPARSTAEERITITAYEADRKLEVHIDGKLFTAYRYPTDLYKPVLYPVHAANGTPITRGWPYEPRPAERTDHPHQVGMWLNYGDVNGLDFWNNSNAIKPENKHRYGTIRHHAVKRVQNGNEQAELEVQMQWLSPDNVVLLQEETRYIFKGDANSRIIDRITTLTAQQQEISLEDNKEGFYAIRVARELEHPTASPAKYIDANGKEVDLSTGDPAVTGKYLSSRAVEGEAVWGTRAEWVALRGTIKDQPVSVTIMDHPKNVGFPTYWMARGYGLFSANPLGQKVLSEGKEELHFKLAPGEAVTFRYRLLIKDGQTQTADSTHHAYEEFNKLY
ncbi:hypothetical protein FVR03_16180 [Pontibacter qinzhouensis]|uniref:Methane oxygenase PmoA n=2 Tax=Pontibacter qinzhouensis TaxID=2603253 RepID=A0A5C8JJE2_9BACT|nr:hypothetical protein FVR03_16180 [Pontibacter qinzhouensis]